MATIKTFKRKSGALSYQIAFYHNKKRKYLSLGSGYSRKEVKTIADLVDRLLSLDSTGQTIDNVTKALLTAVSADVKKRLAKTGLICINQTATLGELFDAYADMEFPKQKPKTVTTRMLAHKLFFSFFDREKEISSITKQDVALFVRELDNKYSLTSRTSFVLNIKRVFNWAIENEIIEKSPFRNAPTGTFLNKKREYYVPIEDYELLLDACPSKMWRTLLALYRIGGLRHGEPLLLQWRDVDFARGSLLVHSPKTEHHPGHESRIIPLFPRLRVELEALFEELEEGCDPYVIPIKRYAIRPTIEKIVFNSGLKRWTRLIQNLRSSAAIDVYEQFGSLAESEWIGHSTITAKNHYLHVLDSTFAKAVAGKTTAKTTTNSSDF